MSGFVDLRLNRRRSIDEGFWPSFTDIMTVVVMIFLMGMVVVLLQNMEVTNNMKSALLEKQKATELAKSTFEEKNIVSHRLSDAEEELARLRMMNILANDQRKTMERQLTSARQELQSLNDLYAALGESHKSVLLEKEAALKEAETALKEKQQSDRELEDKSQFLARIESQLDVLVEQQTVLTAELASSREAQEQSEKKLQAVTLQATSADQELASIRGEYSDLQVKYNKLIKPARTSKGKYVVEVFYSKEDNNDVYKIRDSGQATSTVVNQKQLHSKLAKLKQQHEKNLYIRLIFPEDSKLSYNDAWTFSKEILGKYDYYHND
jgi:hypothetical protein